MSSTEKSIQTQLETGQDDDNVATKLDIPTSDINDVKDDEVSDVEIVDDANETVDKPIDERERIAQGFMKEKRDFDPDKVEDVSDDTDDGGKDLSDVDEKLPTDLIEIIVNGQKRQVEKGKVDAAGGVETYQKQLSANESLREVAENRALLDDEITRIRKREEEISQREQALSTDGHETDLPELDGDLRKDLVGKAKAYREALLDGEDESADEMFLDLLDTVNKSSTPVVDEDKIIETAVNRTITKIDTDRLNNELVTAYSNFKNDFPEISEDRRLYQICNSETIVVKTEHRDWNIAEVMTEAGNRTNEWFGIGDDTSTPDDEVKDEKIIEKRLLSTPKASGLRKKPSAGKKTESNKEYVQKLRALRGLDPT